MKNVKFSLLLLMGVIASFYGCQDNPVTVLPVDKYFVAVNAPSSSVFEGDTITLSVYAILQDDITVDFSIAGTNKDGSALVEGTDFVVLSADDQPLSTKSVTLAKGVGVTEFKVAITDDNITNPGRVLTVSLTGNSANYNLGLDNGKTGKDLDISIKDDEILIEMSELVGDWTVTKEWRRYNGYWEEAQDYTITITEVDPAAIQIAGLMGDNTRTIRATVDLIAKNKIMTIPMQEVFPPIYNGYRTIMHSAGRGVWGTGLPPADSHAVIEKDDAGKISIHWHTPNSQTDGGYGYFEWDAVYETYYGYYYGYMVDNATWNKD
ncbi:MAG: hypothetical protein LBD52_00030 [Prevotellaceae bacterium]|jgi:hypothetical protein|nr:hypothetical protein [Prevotellaceae bacterium]